MGAIAETNIERSPGDVVAHIRYRPDIDGLRAVAVLAVLAWHVGFVRFPGGFVGVDIFFVISGYLIGAIIQRDISIGQFSLAGFYARRICRIMPAFVVMTIGTSVLAYKYFFPVDLRNFARSLSAAALSLSNIYFWSVAGYFDVSSVAQPLIHTWSLAVEEQFYILLPLGLMLAHRMFPRFRQSAILLALAVSLGLSCYLVFARPVSAFYLIPSRAWELLMGTILSFPRLSVPVARKYREPLSLAGGALIGIAVFGFSATTPFPGAAALLPCMGTALIIVAGHSGPTVAGTILSTRPFRFVGLISYSLYLWHWPIIVFQQQYAFLVPNENFTQSGHPFLLRNLVIIVVSFAIATLSWRYVEQPFRQGYRRRSRYRVVSCGAAVAAVLTLMGVITISEQGFSGRFSPQAIHFASYIGYGQQHFRPEQCFIQRPDLASEFDKSTCLAVTPGRRSYFVIGDSIAAQLWHGLTFTLKDSNILQATGAGCKPVLEQQFGAYTECAKVISYGFGTFLTSHRVYAVIISARWTASDLPALARTLATLNQRGIRVIVLGPMVEYTQALPRLLALAVDRNDPHLPDRELIRQPALDAEVAQVAAGGGASYVSMYKLLCSEDACLKTLPGGVPIQFDADHFTREGSVLAAQRLVKSHVLD